MEDQLRGHIRLLHKQTSFTAQRRLNKPSQSKKTTGNRDAPESPQNHGDPTHTLAPENITVQATPTSINPDATEEGHSPLDSPQTLRLNVYIECPKIVTSRGTLSKGKAFHASMCLDGVCPDFHRQEKYLLWIVHEATQRLKQHPVIGILQTPTRFLQAEDVEISYHTDKDKTEEATITLSSELKHHPAPTQEQHSEDWDDDPQGKQSPPTVDLRIRMSLSYNEVEWESQYPQSGGDEAHICNLPPHSIDSKLLSHIKWQHDLELAIVPPKHNTNCFLCQQRARMCVLRILTLLYAPKGGSVNLGQYRPRRGPTARYIPEPVLCLWNEAEAAGWALEEIPHPHHLNLNKMPPIQRGIFQRLTEQDHWVYIFRLIRNKDDLETRDKRPPVIVRFLPNGITVNAGTSKNTMMYEMPPWKRGPPPAHVKGTTPNQKKGKAPAKRNNRPRERQGKKRQEQPDKAMPSEATEGSNRESTTESAS